MIYFAQLPTGAIKVGFSDDVDRRLYQLERRYTQPVALLHTIDGNRQTEREIHERFAHLRFGKTEQFKPGVDLMDFIGKPILVSTNVELTKTYAFRLELDPVTHKDLRVESAKLGKPMTVVVRELIEEFLREKKSREGRN